MIKKILFAALAAFSFTSCEESDLSTENETLPTENVLVATSFLYNDKSIKLDSLYSDAAGNQFYITDVKALVSDMYIINYKTDTLVLSDRFTVSIAQTDKLLTRLTPGGYSVTVHANVGLDSNAVKAVQKSGSLPNDDPLLDVDVKRNAQFTGRGYNHLIIKGKVLDVTNPLDSNATLPFVFKVGTDELFESMRTDIINFRVESSKPIKFIFAIDVGEALATRNILARPQIDSDQSNAPDINAATEIMNLSTFNLF